MPRSTTHHKKKKTRRRRTTRRRSSSSSNSSKVCFTTVKGLKRYMRAHGYKVVKKTASRRRR